MRRTALEAQVLDCLGRQKMQPDLVAEFVRGYAVEWNRLITEEAGATDTRREELRAIERKIANLVIVSPPEFDGDPQGVELVGELVALLRTAGLAPQTESKSAENDHVLGLFAKAVKEDPGAEPLALLPSPDRSRGLTHGRPFAISHRFRPTGAPGFCAPFVF